jgi:beta-lactamase regulating signal transducer with metallopeptidase domain
VIAETILSALLRANLVAGVAILLVLALRRLLLHRCGPRITYWLWLIVPVAALASQLPARTQVVSMPASAILVVAGEPGPGVASTLSTPPIAAAAAAASKPAVSFAVLADALVAVWLLGAATLLARSIRSANRLAADPSMGPALLGMLRPRLLLPADFETRFDPDERALILAHEQVHRRAGHPRINALIEFARCANWFNPLIHLAAIRIRVDQELACDAAVIAAHPQARRVYAEALLKTQVSPAFLRLGCTWTSNSGKRLAERIVMLAQPSGTRLNRLAGWSGIALLGASLGVAAWAQQPARTQNVAVPAPVWTPTADAPKGALSTALEGDRHDRAIALAKKGNIDVVFFGTTNTEMWWWPDRGRPVWDRRFGSVKAANFGSQGTQPRSLVWRMRNGELAGFQAKLVVLQTWLGAGAITPRAEAAATYAPIVAEIRRWQPQARILLLADFPRGELDRDSWRKVARANTAAFAPLVDNRTVFYADMGERFFLPDGTHNQQMWRFPPVSGMQNVGSQASMFEAWADELQPWFDRFVR